MTSDDRSQAVFGCSDGIVTTAGLLLGGIMAHADPQVLLGTVVALAAAGAVSMAGGEYLADEKRDGNNKERALVMGVSMLFASAIPGLGYAIGRSVGNTVAIVSIMAMSTFVALVRSKRHGYFKGFLQTFSVLGIASLAAILATILVGAG